jgi:hypothetical protein
MNVPLLLLLLASPTIAVLGAEANEKAPPAKIEFNRDIRPILSDACFHCHGPDKNAREAGLRLDIREQAVKEAESGEFPIVPGQPEKSALVRRILSDDIDERMPPPKAHKVLTTAQKETLKTWIAQGAEYQQHWAYLPIQRPPVPQLELHPVDAFIRHRLAAENLQPAPEADKVTLIRRVTLDLTGLPPTPAEVDAFINDAAPGAYERVVDRLLASPHYGERMAVDWLDGARFADTNGYQVDRDRTLHAWRERAWAALSECREPTVFFTHYMIINALAGRALDDPRLMIFEPDYCSVTEFAVGPAGCRLVALGKARTTLVL